MSLADAPNDVTVITDPTVAGPAPNPLTADPRYVEPAALAKFDTLCSRMGLIAEGVNAFDDPTLRERAFYELVGIINPAPDEPEPVDVIAVPQREQPFAGSVDLHRLSEWILDKAPTAWRESVQHFEPITDAVIRFLSEGADAWTQTLLVKHALMTAGGFSAEQVDGDLATLIREMAADAPISPEIERLALYLQEEAQPGESAVDVAIRLIERLRSGRSAFIPAAEVADGADGDASRPVDVGLRREPDRVDDREQAQ